MPSPTTSHHQPKYIHHHPAKAKIYSYITSYWHCFNSFLTYEMQYSFPWWRFCVIKFWLVRFPNSKFLLHFMFFKIFWSLYFKSLRLLNTRRVSNQKRQLLSLFSFKRQFNMFFSLCRIDDWKPRIKKN